DREILEHDTRSLLLSPLCHGETLLGGLWFASTLPAAFTREDEATLRPLADLTALALAHGKLSADERGRRQRHEILEALVPTLARALDIREVFDQVSAIAHRVLPHDRLTLGLLSDDRNSIRIYALSGEPVPDMPESFPLAAEDQLRTDWDFQIVRDVAAEIPREEPKCRLLMREGIQSMLRVPIRLEGRVFGGLVFHSKIKARYREEDVEIAHRVADQVALALSHQLLAEEARRTAQARAEAAQLEERVATLTEELESRDGFQRIVGKARSWRDILVQAAKVALTETTVLLTGDSGTGKEVIARAIHRASPRARGPFVAINCAALPDQLLESELCGYEKGAFTGATGSKPGRIEQAAGGVLFLDEAGEMSPVVQAKFLRVLEAREFTRLGGTRALKADVRVSAATNRDLPEAIRRGEFREDLFYRLHVFEIHLPRLRDRVEDILPLTENFLVEFGRAMGRPAAGVSFEARELLVSYPWPGNVRELRNALERATIMAEGGLITAAHLPISVARRDSPGESGLDGSGGASGATGRPGTLPPGGIDLETLERSLVSQALEQARHNKTKAAKLLGLTRAQLYSRIEKYGLSAS
ncbi:MAG: sigma 54-interacting transcriptional regulator, partial [Thermoanaerobaculia bacterium]